MPGFYIKKVTANSAKKGDASVTFGKGLNIIQGRSDSGKTCVANCIDFIYGGQTGRCHAAAFRWQEPGGG